MHKQRIKNKVTHSLYDLVFLKLTPWFVEVSDSNIELNLKLGFDPYKACTPSISSIVNSNFWSLGFKLGYITASLTELCANPNKWPISWVATDSKSIATVDFSFWKSTAHVSAASRWNLPLSGENECAKIPRTPSNGSPSPWSPL